MLNPDKYDNKLYFPNRCYSCRHYRSTKNKPGTNSQIILCSIAGSEIPVSEGCERFSPDNSASCIMMAGVCWHHSFIDAGKRQHYCDIHGKLLVPSTGHCPDHLTRERNETPREVLPNAIEVSKSYKNILKYPEGGSAERLSILDAMRLSGVKNALGLIECCRKCVFESHKVDDLGYCSKHDISLLAYFGPNQYGYDEMVCDMFAVKSQMVERSYSIKIRGDMFGVVEVGPHAELVTNGVGFKLRESEMGFILLQFSITDDDAPLSIEHSEDGSVLTVCWQNRRETFNVRGNDVLHEDEDSTTWLSVDDDELDDAIGIVENRQIEFGVYPGTPHERCEKCAFVVRNSYLVGGSPTGLICSRLGCHVTANGCCDDFG